MINLRRIIPKVINVIIGASNTKKKASDNIMLTRVTSDNVMAVNLKFWVRE